MLRIVWEFVVKQGKAAEYEAAYGPDGIWAQFFRTGNGYIRTELQAVAGKARTYRTTDIWESRASYDAFKTDRSGDYEAIDVQCEELTEQEACLGYFEDADAKG